MCGIAGIVSPAAGPDALTDLASRMRDKLLHRGPDGNGVSVHNGIALAHTRLSIIDLSDAATQPMISADGRYVLSYNGELYNYPELRRELQAIGVSFRTQSDTEVVLEAFAAWGTSAFKKFNGMFAVAIQDKESQRLVLARDRFGIKPLYYHMAGQSLYFASEIKAILAALPSTPSLSRQGLIEYLHYGITHGSETLFHDIKKLPSGHYLEWQAGSAQVTPFWELHDLDQSNPSRMEAVERIRELLGAAVERHLLADVPVGLFLSGGLDSATLCALAAPAVSGRLKTWSVEFEGSTANSELGLARQVAERYATDHHELFLGFNSLPDVIDQLTDAHDQPFGDAASIPLYLMTQELKGDIKVVLQGDGGDELFGGYKRYRLLQHRWLWRMLGPVSGLTARLPQDSRACQRLHRMLSALSASERAECSARLLTEEVSDAAVSSMFKEDVWNALKQHDPFHRYREQQPEVSHLPAAQAMLYSDSQILLPDQFLEKVDRVTMANSIEVRVPMLDRELADYVMSLPASMKLAGSSKSLLREAMTPLLPADVVEGGKLGFGVPYGEWLGGPLAEFTRERLLSEGGLLRQLFTEQSLQRLCTDSSQGRGHRSFMLYKLLMLASWAEKYNVSYQ